MTDHLQTTAGRFDDDRLLAYSLGLDDDPELASALDMSPELRERLERIGRDVVAIRDGLRDALPPAPADYAEPAAPRWSALRPYFAARGDAPVRRRSRRLLVPALAAALLLAVIVAVAVRQLPGDAGKQVAAQSREDGETRAIAPMSPGAAPVYGQTQESSGLVLLERAAAFRDVLVVRAGAVADKVQQLAIVRVLKGAQGAPEDALAMRIRVGASALPLGKLFVVYVGPLGKNGGGTAGGGGGAVPEGGLSPTPWAADDDTAAKSLGGGMPEPVAGYSTAGDEALVQQLPEGMDVSRLAVP